MSEITDGDRFKAAELVDCWNGEYNDLRNRIAAALAARSAAVVDRVLAVVEELQGTAEITGGKVNGFVFADRLRGALAGAIKASEAGL